MNGSIQGRIQEELLDSNDELLELMFLDQIVSKFVDLDPPNMVDPNLGRNNYCKERHVSYDQIWNEYI